MPCVVPTGEDKAQQPGGRRNVPPRRLVPAGAGLCSRLSPGFLSHLAGAEDVRKQPVCGHRAGHPAKGPGAAMKLTSQAPPPQDIPQGASSIRPAPGTGQTVRQAFCAAGSHGSSQVCAHPLSRRHPPRAGAANSLSQHYSPLPNTRLLSLLPPPQPGTELSPAGPRKQQMAASFSHAAARETAAE